MRGPRRKWGWLFIVLFVVQAFVFMAIIGTTLADAGREQSLGQSFIDRPARGCEDMSCRIGYAESSFSRARSLEQQAKMLMIVAVISSIITLTLAIVGLRRRKVQPVAP
jgi:hypothetical protein